MVCPLCRGALARDDEALRCDSCGTTFELAEGVPVLVPPALSDQHEHQRGYFDAEFAGFGRYEVGPWRHSFNERIFRALRLSPEHEPYLDVGVGGSGATVIEAARSGVASVGCDLSVEGVSRAAHFARMEGVDERTTFAVCAAERLPFRDSSVGSASAVAVLEHLDDDAEAADELARVVRTGGRIWITVPHAYRYIPPPLWPFYLVHDRRIGHKRHYDEARLKRLFETRGFRHVETQWTGHPVKVAQYALTLVAERLHRDMTSVWWSLERADLRARRRRLGALQISAVFERT
jgi:SAM-dependent methyltransferase